MASGNGRPGDIQGPFTDAQGRTYYLVGGQKSYQSPTVGGGPTHPGTTFNTDTGNFDKNSSWGDILTAVAAGMLTVGVASALLGGGEIADAAVQAASEGNADAGISVATDAGVDIAAPASETAASTTATTLPSTATVPTATATLPTATTSGAVPGALSTAGTIAGGGSTASKIMNLLGNAGTAVSGAAGQAGVNSLEQEKLALEANQQNITGQSAYENELINIAKENAAAQEAARKNAFRLSVAQNPRTSPYDTAGSVQFSPSYVNTLQQNAQAPTPIANPAPYTPIPPSSVQKSTGTAPSPLQQVGSWVGPGLKIASTIGSLFGGS